MRIDELFQENPNLVYLSNQPAIAWDFLGTLSTGPADYVLQKFIKEHPKIKHYVITTLDEGNYLAPFVVKKMRDSKINLTEKNFAGIIGTNKYLYMTGSRDEQQRYRDIHFDRPTQPVTSEEEYVKYFKENICKNLNIKVLVDDDNRRWETCKEFGIKLINPEDCL